MKRVISALTGALFVAAMCAALVADEKTVKGEVVDVQCQAKKAENHGADHESCAMRCAQKGAKMGILTDDGVYAITGDYAADNNKKLIEFVAKNVEATGEVTEKDGQKTIKVTSMKLQN
ncbi:MAG: hypothetical protein ACRD1S_19825 [Vicinamibacterales bacterium]